MRMLHGACEPLLTARPLAPLWDIAVAEPRIAQLIADRAEPMLLFNALLDSLRSRPGSLLVLEDLHWADDATLDLLRFLGRRLTDVRARRPPSRRRVLNSLIELPGGKRF